MIYLVDSESLTKYSPDDNNDLSKSKLRKSAKARTVSENKKVATIRTVCTGNDSCSLWLP